MEPGETPFSGMNEQIRIKEESGHNPAEKDCPKGLQLHRGAGASAIHRGCVAGQVGKGK